MYRIVQPLRDVFAGQARYHGISGNARLAGWQATSFPCQPAIQGRIQSVRHGGHSGRMITDTYDATGPIPPGAGYAYGNPRTPIVPDAPAPINPEYLARALSQLAQNVEDLASIIKSRNNAVDEYRPQSLGGETVLSYTWQPEYEGTEVIESIVITGPPAGTCELSLGARNWNLVMPASGFLLIAPVKVRLERSAGRYLTAGAAGDWAVELMGYVDVGRKNIA